MFFGRENDDGAVERKRKVAAEHAAALKAQVDQRNQ